MKTLYPISEWIRLRKKYGGKINSDKAHKILTLLVKVPGGKSNFIGSKKKNRKISKFKYIRLF